MTSHRSAPLAALLVAFAAGCGGRVIFGDAGDVTTAPDAQDASVAPPDAMDAMDAADSALVAPDVAPDVAADAPAPMDAPPPVDVVTADAPRLDAPADAPAPVDAPGDASPCETGGTPCTTGATLYCADLQSDDTNCGTCGNRCCAGERCVAGRCSGALGCPPGMIVCGSGCSSRACLNVLTNSRNCGLCNHACADDEYCSMGLCVRACAAASVPAAPTGVCDGRGMIACQRWAQESAGGNPNATATCVSAPAGCVRADSCARHDDPSSCRCGSEPACGPNEVCALSGPTARCVCAGTAM